MTNAKLISIPFSELSEIEINESIIELKQLPTIEDPIFWLSIGLFTCILSGVIFFDIIRSKIEKWSTNKISPLPLINLQSISSWISFFAGLTIIFSSTLNIFNFSIVKSILFSLAIAILFGIGMWNAITDLLLQIESGTVKEIDEFF